MTARAGSSAGHHWLAYLPFGVYFGIVLAKGEVISWFRIQEMFRFQSFHMYGVIGSAVVVAAVSLLILRRSGGSGGQREPLAIADKPQTRLNTRYWLGGACFGLGWGLLGACPGPIYTLIGSGVTVALVSLAAALSGTVAYAALQRSLPH